jgi:hypothetical protein
MTSKKKPIVAIEVPINVMVEFLTLFRIKPEMTVVIKNTIMNGNCTFATARASPPNPNGTGLRTITGIVRYTVKMERNTNIMIIVGGRKFLLDINFKSSMGNLVLFSVMTNAASDIADITKSPTTT